MATILNNKKSTYGSPYAYYTVETTNIENRTATSVDITFKITSNLAYASSSLGRGYTLNGNLYINNSWSENITLKASSESWSGTTKHYKTITLTIDNLTSTDTILENVKFRVVSSASDNASGLNATACSNIEIPIGHTPPLITSFTTQEINPLLSGVEANTIVENLSILRFIVDYELYDNASVLRTGIYNNIYPYTTNDFTIIQPGQLRFDLDCSQINFYVDDNKIPIVTRVIDSFETQGLSSPLSQSTMFNRIPYVKPYILETNTKAQRLGQTSGRVGLTINGTFYNNNIGNTTQSIKIYYKYWSASQTEPQSYELTNVIPNENVTISGNNFEVSAYDIGNSDEQATNWFNPEEAYRIKVKVVDSFTEYESSELSIPVGESIWDEHKDHVDFKKLTVKENNIYNELFHSNGDILELGANSGNERYCINGFITTSTTKLLFNIHTDKSMKDINTITCLELNVESRGINGYLNNTSGYVDYVGLSEYTINCYKVDNHNIRVSITKSSAFTNTSNNTLINLNGYFKFELSYVE